MILIIDDDSAVRASLALLLKKEGYASHGVAAPEEALAFLQTEQPALILLDMNFSLDTSGEEGLQLLKAIGKLQPAVPVILITGWATVDLAVEGMKLGARDFVNKPWDNEYLMQSIRTVLELSQLRGLKMSRRKLEADYDFGHIIGQAPAFLKVLETVGRVAATDAPVLIMGESGTGKELIAEAIHQNSRRQARPFVKVNLGGISSSLFESEMFGHVRGAFTDARSDRVGRFEMANTGTIFLDEIGDLGLSSQVKLLRVLQDRTYEVLGSSRTRKVDVRVVSATNRRLEEMVADGSFREDLFYRINLITIQLPPLRERPEDIPLLLEFFLGNLREIYNRPRLKATKAAMQWLEGLSLPGNIRQLKNLVERTVLVSPHDELQAGDFQAQMQAAPRRAGGDELPPVGAMTLEEMEVEMIKKAMAHHRNKVARVARSLGLTRSSLYRRLDKYGISYEDTD
ncbi:MAG: sigma-54-dependent Fis family transcriptional regulator [Lewinellaceae bacterium]|nr:sigma-54-dependent Fis family transcriptional regulator [Phaeodactylibacter sp.]MCB9036034.1 sigma-54-dependent Fis family transcriptional regulator [Lewinellaceae bacterium]